MIYDFDLSLFRWLNSWALWRPWADTVIIFRAAFLGWVLLAGFFVLGALAVLPKFRHLWKKNMEMAVVTFGGAFIARFGIIEIIRFFYNRPRPFEVLSDVNQLVFRDGAGSFPSGHAAFYFAIAAGISRYYPKTGLIFYFAALSISLNRVIAGVHWPSDIIAGAFIGIVAGYLAVAVFCRFFGRK